MSINEFEYHTSFRQRDTKNKIESYKVMKYYSMKIIRAEKKAVATGKPCWVT